MVAANSGSRLGRHLYRAILKEIRTISVEGDRIFLQEQLDSRKQGWKWFPGGSIRALPTQFDVLEQLVPLGERSRSALRAWQASSTDDHRTGFSKAHLASIARSIFKSKMDIPSSSRSTPSPVASNADGQDYDEAFASMRAIMDQRHRAECSSCSQDARRGLTITAMSCYAAEDSDKRGSHLFTYRITVQNHGPVPLKCIGRHWYVIGEDGQLAGELPENLRTFSYDPPTLASGACLEYHSAVDLEAAAGMMSGVMMFRDDQGRDFDVVVGPFALLSDEAVRGTAIGRDSNAA